MIHYHRTNSDNPDFQKLVAELDILLSIHDGEEHAFYAQYNKIDSLKFVIVAYDNETPIGCGAIKQYSTDTMEVKRMFVLPNRRGAGIATAILKELEKWSIELGYHNCVLETGKNLYGAIELYKKNGYCKIPNYGQYEHAENSECFEKTLV